MELNRLSVVVTGAGSGMGAATSRYLSKLGAKLCLFDMNQEAVGKLAKEISATACVVDVTQTEQVEQGLQQANEINGVPRVCVNCAGIVTGARVVGKEGPMPLADFQKIIDVNLIGTFNVMRLFLANVIQADPINDDNERGVVINTASIAGVEGQIGQAAYSASKAGVMGMTLPIAREMAKFGVRINTIAPGLIETPMLSGMPDKVQQALLDSTVYPKRLGKPEEFARLVAHIVENPLFNGEIIRLDGAVRLQ